MSSVFDPTVLRVHCPSCGGRITLQCEPEDPTAGPQSYSCPYCRQPHRADVGARIRWVTMGHDDPPRV